MAKNRGNTGKTTRGSTAGEILRKGGVGTNPVNSEKPPKPPKVVQKPKTEKS